MPWSETTRMDERRRFIELLESCRFTMTELCDSFGIARKTGYKWAERYVAAGLEGLEDRSRAPKRCPHATEQRCVEALVEERRRHPRWGPRKLLDRLGRRHPDWGWPAVSTAGEILKRHGLVPPRRRRSRRPTVFKKPEIRAAKPNDLWSTDYKGEFRLRNRRLCYPLTAMDHVSRYLLECRARESVAIAGARPVFEALFRRYGLPRAILCDNGSPFAAVQAPCRLSRLSVWWVRLGIVPIFIQPGHPEQNSAHERMHRTLKAETTRPPSATFNAQQRDFDRFRREYNSERPHESLEMDRPEERYESSIRPYPETVPEIDYPGHYEVRRVSRKGTIRWRQRQVFFSESLARERIGLEEVDEGLWSIYLADLLLGRYDERCGETEWL